VETVEFPQGVDVAGAVAAVVAVDGEGKIEAVGNDFSGGKKAAGKGIGGDADIAQRRHFQRQEARALETVKDMEGCPRRKKEMGRAA
jgi:hypothetical protein